MKFLHILLSFLIVSNVALADRKQNDNIDMNGNAIKNADVQGGTASNTSRITIPKNTKSNLDALTRKEGTVVYGTDTAKLYVDNGSLLSPVGSGEGGTGVNAVANPSAATDLTGYSYTGGIGPSRHTTAADLPLYPAVATGISIPPDMGGDYVAYCGQMPAALKNRKLRFSQFQKPESGYASGDLKLEIYPSTASDCSSVGTKYVLSKDSSGVTSIPKATQDFWVTFDPDDSDYFQVRWVRVDGTALFVVQNVYIGAGDMPTGPPEHGWVSYTPTFSAQSGSPSLGNGTISGFYRRINDSAEVQIRFTVGSTTNLGSNAFLFSIPPNLTIDTAKLPGGGGAFNTVIGSATVLDSGSGYYDGATVYAGTTTVGAVSDGAAFRTNNPITFITSDAVTLHFTVPIAEWSSSGNVNYGQQDVEYACNDGSGGTTANTTYSTGMTYGQSGCQFVSVASTTADQATRYKVSFQSPIQQNDLIVLETYQSGYWGTGNIATTQRIFQGTSQYGMWWEPNDSTSVYVAFGNKGARPNNASYAGDGTAWSTFAGSSTFKWRLKKISGNALGGFQYATATSMGLVKSGTDTHSTTFTANGTGGGTSISGTIKITKSGSLVTLEIMTSSTIVGAGTSSTKIESNTAIPAAYRPVSSVGVSVPVRNGGVDTATPGLLVVSSGGVITIYRDASNAAFTNSADCGLAASRTTHVSISYQVL